MVDHRYYTTGDGLEYGIVDEDELLLLNKKAYQLFAPTGIATYWCLDYLHSLLPKFIDDIGNVDKAPVCYLLQGDVNGTKGASITSTGTTQDQRRGKRCCF